MLSVADITQMEALDLRVAGGRAGLGARVRGVHTSELDDPTPWLRGGELLLTTGQPLRGDAAGYVRRLAGRGLAGLGLGLGFGLDSMPDEATDLADELGFPVFTIPYEVPFIAISEAVFAELAGRRIETLERMTELALEDRPLEALLAELAAIAGVGLLLRDRDGRVLARAGLAEEDEPRAAAQPIATGARVEAELLSLPTPATDRALLHHIRTVLAVELLRRRAVADTELRLAGDLVEAIVGGEMGARELHRRSAAFGLSGRAPMTFAVLRPGEPGASGLARLAERAAAYGPATIRDGGVAVLFEASADAEAEQAAGRMLRETGAGAAGVGRLRHAPAELPRSYEEALYAIEARPPNGTPVVATFRDLGSMQLLLSLQGDRGMELFCDSLLGPLVAHDRRHGSALVESLRAYIEANGRWADAAAALSVHRHTLRYRVRKIEELTGRTLTDAGDRLELWLALRAHDLRRRREADPPAVALER
jgi:purine catabolism regulator